MDSCRVANCEQPATMGHYTEPCLALVGIGVGYDHPQRSVNYRGQMIRVDQQMVDLLRKLWDLHIETIWSCQGGLTPTLEIEDDGTKFLTWEEKRGYIQFTDKLMLDQFCRLVNDPTLYQIDSDSRYACIRFSHQNLGKLRFPITHGGAKLPHNPLGGRSPP